MVPDAHYRLNLELGYFHKMLAYSFVFFPGVLLQLTYFLFCLL
jgi:hypothetical protein